MRGAEGSCGRVGRGRDRGYRGKAAGGYKGRGREGKVAGGYGGMEGCGRVG